MKCVDAEKFNKVFLDIEKQIKPNEGELKTNPMAVTYWSAVSVVLHAVRKAAEQAAVDVPNASFQRREQQAKRPTGNDC